MSDTLAHESGWELTQQVFESSIFGGPVFRLVAPESRDAELLSDGLHHLIDGPKAQNAKLIMCRIDSSQRRIIDLLSAFGFVQVETLITLETDIIGGDVPSRIRPGSVDDADSCASIARQAFSFDRFHVDRRIDPVFAGALKEAWVRNGLAGRADASFIATGAEDGAIAGFILTLRREMISIIDLVAVAPSAQGRGIGRDLIAAVSAHAARSGATRLRVGTQSANQASLRLYRAAGFRPVAEKATLHFIPERWWHGRSGSIDQDFSQ